MHKGKWNYTEDITFRVVLAKLGSVENPPAHWQNAFVGRLHQVVEIHSQRKGEDPYTFWISNHDGSGIRKLEAGGGPDSTSWHLEPGTFEILQELPLSDWNYWNPTTNELMTATVEAWQKEHQPAEYEKIQSLKKAWKSSPFNRANQDKLK